MNKKAFSFVEIIISISILVVLAIVATTATTNIKNNSNNSRVIADLATIKNGFISYSNEGATLAAPQGNKNFYTQDGSYAHDRSEAFGVYGKVTENTIEKRYLSIVPLDPRTNQYYSYGVAIDSNQFEVAGVLFNEEGHRAKVEGNYSAENGIYNLIREHNGNNFVIDKGPYLPYNPEERILTARDSEGNVYSTGDEIVNNNSDNMELYFSDGSTSVISPGTTLVLTEMDFPKDNNLVSKVKIFLEAGSIWTQATSLDDESSFDIFTSDTTASVRGTIFSVNTDGTKTEVLVERGEVQVKKNPTLIKKEDILIKPSIISNQIETIKNDNSITPIELIQNDPSFTKVKKVDMTNPGSILEPALLDVKNVDFSKISSTMSFSKNQILNEDGLSINTQNAGNGKSCYLEGVEIKDGITREAYYSKEANDCDTVIDSRTCNDGILEGNTDYKFASCKEPTSCPSHFTETIQSISFDVGGLNLSIGESQIINSLAQSIKNGVMFFRDEIHCGLDYTYSHDDSFIEHTVSCESGYEPGVDPSSGMNICVSTCSGELIDFGYGFECVEDNLDWKIYGSAQYGNHTGKNDEYLYKLQLVNGSFKMPNYNSNALGHASRANTSVIDNSWDWEGSGSNFYFKGDSTNIYLDNIANRGCDKKFAGICVGNPDAPNPNGQDYLKYNGLFDEDEFAIEISVMGKDLKRDDGKKYYLFDIGDLELYVTNGRVYGKDKTGTTNKILSFDISNGDYDLLINSKINNYEFYKIILKVDEDDLSLYIKKENGDNINNPLSDKINKDISIKTIYVGSNDQKEEQWNGLIEYVTIYEED